MHKTSRLRVTDVNPHLLCVLCSGYFVDATCIIECLHAFCRSCITKYLEGSRCCPICDVMVHKTKPTLNLRPDKTLQTLVYKLIPGLYKEEMRRRKEFYVEHPNAAPPVSAPNAAEERGETDPDRYQIQENVEKISLILEHCARLPLPSNTASTTAASDDPEEYSDQRYLLCPSSITVAHLKKFLRCKFDIGEVYKLELFYDGDECLPEAYTLADVATLFGWTRMKPLRIFYIVLDTNEICWTMPVPKSCEPIVINKARALESVPMMPKFRHSFSDLAPDDADINSPVGCEDEQDPTESKHTQDAPDDAGSKCPIVKESDHSGSDMGTAAEALSNKQVTMNYDDQCADVLQQDTEYATAEVAKKEITDETVVLSVDNVSSAPDRNSETSTKKEDIYGKHSHKKKKKKKKHKRSKSREYYSESEESRAVIKVRIPKAKLSPEILNPTISHLSGPFSSKAILSSGQNGAFTHSESNEKDGSKTDVAVFQNIPVGSKNNLFYENVDNINGSSATKASQLPASHASTLRDLSEDNDSVYSDSELDTSKHKEYTCQLSQDGKMVLHSSTSAKVNTRAEPVNIVVEETPPQIIEVGAETEQLAFVTKSSNQVSLYNGESLQKSMDTNNMDLPVILKQTDSSSLNQTIEADKSVVIEVDESVTLVDPTQLDAKSYKSEEAVRDVTTDSRPVLTAGSTDAHNYRKQQLPQTVGSKASFGVPTNVHSSLSPPSPRHKLKRSQATHSDLAYKQFKLDNGSDQAQNNKRSQQKTPKPFEDLYSSESHFLGGHCSLPPSQNLCNRFNVYSSLSPEICLARASHSSVSPEHCSPKSTSSNMSPEYQASKSTGSSMSPEYQASRGTVSSMSPEYQASKGTVSSMSPEYQASKGTGSSMSPEYQASKGTVSSMSPDHGTTNNADSSSPEHASCTSHGTLNHPHSSLESLEYSATNGTGSSVTPGHVTTLKVTSCSSSMQSSMVLDASSRSFAIPQNVLSRDSCISSVPRRCSSVKASPSSHGDTCASKALQTSVHANHQSTSKHTRHLTHTNSKSYQLSTSTGSYTSTLVASSTFSRAVAACDGSKEESPMTGPVLAGCSGDSSRLRSPGTSGALSESSSRPPRAGPMVTKKAARPRGPLRERPVTLSVGSGHQDVSAVAKPLYNPLALPPLFQSHVHPSLSAISGPLHDQNPLPSAMKQLRLMCGEMSLASASALTRPSLPRGFGPLQTSALLAHSRQFLSPIFSSPMAAGVVRGLPSPSRVSPLSPNHFPALPPAHFAAMSPPHAAAPLSLAPYDSPLELTTRASQDRRREQGEQRRERRPALNSEER